MINFIIVMMSVVAAGLGIVCGVFEHKEDMAKKNKTK